MASILEPKTYNGHASIHPPIHPPTHTHTHTHTQCRAHAHFIQRCSFSDIKLLASPLTRRLRCFAMSSDLGPFEVGQIWALHREGFSHREIAERVTRGRDSPGPSLCTIGDAVRRLDSDPTWTGGRECGSGRKRNTTAAEDKCIVRAAKRHRGLRAINATSLQAIVPAARRVSRETVRRRLREAGLRYLRRRCKTLVPKESVASRLAWASWVKAQRAAYLRRWVFTDGVSFFCSRTAAEHESSTRAALGRFVWREPSSKDALFRDCVGPSSYVKGQGALVRMWGLLVHNKLYICVLPQGVALNRHVYTGIISNHFSRWLRRVRRPILVQDHERALWCDEPRAAMEEVGITVLEKHPKHSADLNAIENVWALLRERLAATLPPTTESRAAFVSRLRAAVLWLNRNRSASMRKLAGDMKERALAVQDNQGHRIAW